MVDGYSRFQDGGYWFGFVEPWPEDWYYTDDVYVDYADGGTYTTRTIRAFALRSSSCSNQFSYPVSEARKARALAGH